MRYLSSFGRLATCVERTELQSLPKNFNEDFWSNKTHFTDCLDKGFEIPAYKERSNIQS